MYKYTATGDFIKKQIIEGLNNDSVEEPDKKKESKTPMDNTKSLIKTLMDNTKSILKTKCMVKGEDIQYIFKLKPGVTKKELKEGLKDLDYLSQDNINCIYKRLNEHINEHINIIKESKRKEIKRETMTQIDNAHIMLNETCKIKDKEKISMLIKNGERLTKEEIKDLDYVSHDHIDCVYGILGHLNKRLKKMRQEWDQLIKDITIVKQKTVNIVPDHIDTEMNNINEICFSNPNNNNDKLCMNYDYLKQLYDMQDSTNISEHQGPHKLNGVRKEVPNHNYALSKNSVIPGNNAMTLTHMNTNDCKKICNSNDWCKSFDFNKKNNSCNLSSASRGTSTLKKNSRYDYFEKENLIKKSN
jgi:hypothetical protein